jgi:ubiquinone/menaquinone biosynthesis C-methylase UbiE
LSGKKIVRAGYDKIATRYTATRTLISEDVQLLQLLVERLPTRAIVLDAGCGSGYPVTQFLAESFQVTGVDFSDVQLRLAKTSLPDSAFVSAEIAKMPFKNDVFDALCSYYAIVHVPRHEHSKLLLDFHRILKAGGLALLCLGAGDLPEDNLDWLGTEMFWSHYDLQTNLEMVKESGFSIVLTKIVKDPIDLRSAHLFLLGQKEH